MGAGKFGYIPNDQTRPPGLSTIIPQQTSQLTTQITRTRSTPIQTQQVGANDGRPKAGGGSGPGGNEKTTNTGEQPKALETALAQALNETPPDTEKIKLSHTAYQNKYNEMTTLGQSTSGTTHSPDRYSGTVNYITNAESAKKKVVDLLASVALAKDAYTNASESSKEAARVEYNSALENLDSAAVAARTTILENSSIHEDLHKTGVYQSKTMRELNGKVDQYQPIDIVPPTITETGHRDPPITNMPVDENFEPLHMCFGPTLPPSCNTANPATTQNGGSVSGVDTTQGKRKIIITISE